MPITSKYTIVCDDVRREDNGKLILLGVYADKMIVAQFPITLPTLTFLCALQSNETVEQTPLKYRLENTASGEVIISGEAVLAGLPGPGHGTAIFRLTNLTIPSPGKYQFILELEGQPSLAQPLEVVSADAIAGLSSENI
jgi:hypothetical protein